MGTVFTGWLEQGNHAPPRAPSPSPSAPTPARSGVEWIAEVDRLADVARATKGAGPALDAWDAAAKALDAAANAGAADKDVKPRRAVIDKALAKYTCEYEGERRGGPVRNMLLTHMANAGMAGNVRVSGKCNDTITIEWALWTDVTVHQFQVGSAGRALEAAGFRKVVLKAWDSTWTWEPQ
jgi:hypothetical protein